MTRLVLQVMRLHGQPLDGLQLVVGAGLATLGRADGNDLVLPDPDRQVSRLHACVRGDDSGHHTLEDRGGVPLRLNGRVLPLGRRWPLAAGDRLVIGGYEIEVRAADPATATPPPATPAAATPAAVDDGETTLPPPHVDPERTIAMRPAATRPAAPAAAARPAPAPPNEPLPAAEPAPADNPPSVLPDDWDPFEGLGLPPPAPLARPPAAPDAFEAPPTVDESQFATRPMWPPLPPAAPQSTRSSPAVPAPPSLDDLFGLGTPSGADDSDPFGLGDLSAPPPAAPPPAPPAPAPLPPSERTQTRAPDPVTVDENDYATRPLFPPPPPDTGPPEPVWFAVTAPTQLPASRRFVAALAVHVDSLRATAEQQLQRLGGPGAEPLMDLPPARQAGWRHGAPVTVRLEVLGGRADPPRQDFDWNGRLNLAAFRVQADDDTADTLELCFHVLLAGLPMGMVPLTVSRAAALPVPRPRPAPASAFASYASADADAVGLCLSTLAHWAPALAIFQDCLDLRPGDAFKPQLAQHIRDSDAFLLFWSRRAAASPWVRWELETARLGRGLDAVVPMPLEDPAIAPPPPELAERHWRDRYLIARYGLKRIAQLAGR